MASTSSTPNVFEENELPITLIGDQAVQVTEEELEDTESDEDGDSRSEYGHNALSTMSAVPQSLVKPGAQPTYGSVQVQDSENVHFGDNITGEQIILNFKGPVVIKQVVQSKEQDNPAYEQTEDETPPTNNNRPPKITTAVAAQAKPSNLKLWLKLSFSAVCIVILGGICAIVSITLTYTGQENTTSANGEEQDSSTECISVEGIHYGHLNLIIMSVLTVILIFIACAKLLTTETGNAASYVATNSVPNRTRSYNVEADPLLIAPTHLRIVSRTDWLAQPVEKPLDIIRLPVPWVIIQHTATESCYTQSECVRSVRLIQMYHIESRGWFDIGYNFLVAGDGSAYFGRGWEYQGAHTLGYNKYSMGIAFIGTFNNEPPPKKQLDACKKLIQRGVELGKIAKDYKLFAHRQLSSTLSPGEKLFEILKEWPHFVKNATDIDSLLPDY